MLSPPAASMASGRFALRADVVKYEYATRDGDKVESAKASLTQQAARKGEEIVGFHVYTSSDYPKLQQHDAAKGVEHTIVLGFTTQAELDRAGTQ
jgi:hypothetical protein